MRPLLRFGCVLSLVLAPALCPPPAAAEPACPEGSVSQAFDGLLLCVPAANQRYRFTKDGIDWMAWSGDAPVARTAKDASGEIADQTLARAWVGESVVGKSDQASGRKGFDQFLSLMALGILKAANAPEAGGSFAADVPVDESGQTLPYSFSRLQPDLLAGTRVREDVPAPGIILFRPSSGTEQPHLALCNDGDAGADPIHMCISMFDLGGHRAGIMAMGRDLARIFRISESVAADLAGFVAAESP